MPCFKGLIATTHLPLRLLNKSPIHSKGRKSFHHKVVALDNLIRGRVENVPTRATRVEDDCGAPRDGELKCHHRQSGEEGATALTNEYGDDEQ